VVGRDARDVAMSMWNHYANYTEESIEKDNNLPGRVGEPLSPPPDLHAYWCNFFTRGWFPWESEGYPFWGNLHHTQTWWDYRQLPNILFVHYNDLLTDLPGEIQRIAGFLAIPLAEGAVPAILPSVRLPAMRDKAERLDLVMKMIWKDGAKTFFFKGTNGRWKDGLSAEELALYEEAVARVLTPDCRAWLEQGRVAFVS
jgi:aryl sulfotransferase